ncbi:Uncharacterised protein [Mycolicibacterium vanbaalenii]|uniref:DUF305 domain-containing protein n=1 Tax=Mycolicibacterium vanbaalenii TaxID=110539 RepID=A0A5S9QYX4_MYCVN|nr:DUF305 domain-containing protein [Mycolicibacterium vanbaalenii]CAA0124749.1 Uncharacterised protein [Mycolicibacterium vanbaalenii]
MRSIPTRLSAAFAAVLAAFLLAACGGSADSAGDGAGPEIPETPVITGEPAGYNADDVSFATNMVTHHKQAIDLSKLVPERSENPELAALANQIAAVQQPEINIMNVFLVQWNENPEAASDTGEDGSAEGHAGHGQPMQGMVDDATMTKLESLRGTEFDRLWLESMISHHQGAVEMAKAEIAHGKNVDAIAMAKTMVATQEAEIVQMKQMLEGGRP